jgi:hypothetical protein
MSDDDAELRDEAAPDDTVLPSPEASDEAEEEFHPFDEIAEDYGMPEAGSYVIGQDGMPAAVDGTTPSDIPALSVQSLICMADTSAYVIRNGWGEVIARFLPAEVEHTPNGQTRVKAELAMQRAQEQRPGCWRARQAWVIVEPLRPACRHYVRQETQLHLNAQHSMFVRLCAARRTTEGTFMTVRDTGLWACNMREPRDIPSEARMEAFDRRKIREGAKREHLPMFSSGEGIFDPPEGDKHA